MMNHYPLFISFVCAGLLVSCSKFGSDKNSNTHLARVDNTYLTLDQAKEEISDFALEQDSLTALREYRDQWVQRQLLLKEARNLQLTQQPEIQKQLQKAREEVLINGLKSTIQSQYDSQENVSDAEALFYFEQNKQHLILNERYVKLRYIETSDLTAARTARQYLQNDSSWVDVARNFSINPDEKIAMAERLWPVSSLFPDLAIMKRYVTTLDSGQVSPIQRREGVYRFVQLTDVRSQGETAEPEWFINELKDWLIHDKRRKYYNSYVKNLYLNAKEDNEIELYNVSTKNINDNTDSIETSQENE